MFGMKLQYTLKITKFSIKFHNLQSKCILHQRSCMNRGLPLARNLSNGHQSNKNKGGTEESDRASFGTRIAVLSFGIFGTGYYFLRTKNKTKENEFDPMPKQSPLSTGKADIGNINFNLIDQDGKSISKESFRGQWWLIYFGFTHCPDICPEELNKISKIVNVINADKSIPNLVPVFLSVDPERDTPEVIKDYLHDFNANIIGLTGTMENIKDTTKAFRVYFNAGPKDKDNDYIIDHTTVAYLMNPLGDFVAYYGASGTPMNLILQKIKSNMQDYKAQT